MLASTGTLCLPSRSGPHVIAFALKRVMRGIERVALPADTNATNKRHLFAIPFGQRGVPNVKTSATRREPAMCNIPAAIYANPK